MKRFIIEDEFHANWCGEFGAFADALAEIRRRAALPWGEGPNSCPCQSWRTCHASLLRLPHQDGLLESLRAMDR